MTTRGRLVDVETLSAMRLLRASFSLRQIGTELGIAHGTVDAIVRNRPGAISIEDENRIRGLMELPLLTIPARPCPTCQVVHGDGYDCHGAHVQMVRRKAPQRIQDMTPAALRWAIENREEMNNA